METFPERLKELRKAKDLKQSELADMLGVSMYTVSVWERGLRKPEYANLDMLCDVFKVNLGYLMGTNDDPTPPGEMSESDLTQWLEAEEKDTFEHVFRMITKLDEDSRMIVFAAAAQAYKLCKAHGTAQPGYEVTVSPKPLEEN